MTAAAERILSRPATTLAGIMVKLRVRQKAGMYEHHEGEQAVLNSIEIDLKAMTGLEDRS